MSEIRDICKACGHDIYYTEINKCWAHIPLHGSIPRHPAVPKNYTKDPVLPGLKCKVMRMGKPDETDGVDPDIVQLTVFCKIGDLNKMPNLLYKESVLRLGEPQGPAGRGE